MTLIWIVFRGRPRLLPIPVSSSTALTGIARGHTDILYLYNNLIVFGILTESYTFNSQTCDQRSQRPNTRRTHHHPDWNSRPIHLFPDIYIVRSVNANKNRLRDSCFLCYVSRYSSDSDTSFKCVLEKGPWVFTGICLLYFQFIRHSLIDRLLFSRVCLWLWECGLLKEWWASK